MTDTSWCHAVPILPRLRAETRDLHAAAESTLAVPEGGLGAAAYATVLERWYGFLVVLEPRLSSWHRTDRLLDWERRRKLHLLAADLDVLGTDSRVRAMLPRCPHVPSIDGAADALGALYVVEGSTLGARVQRDRLCTGPLPRRAFSFLESYGPQTGRRWRDYRCLTSAWVGDDPARADAVVAAARATFGALVTWQASGSAR
jgi:heme oxygenase